jgi:protein-ribulosamine 3-kinase
LGDLFAPEPAVLLHGDLGSGNFLCADSESPVLIDPAVYYGHPSIDMAMTTLFGGSTACFMSATTIIIPCLLITDSNGTYAIYTHC